jgi:hypothetical protein
MFHEEVHHWRVTDRYGRSHVCPALVAARSTFDLSASAVRRTKDETDIIHAV